MPDGGTGGAVPRGISDGAMAVAAGPTRAHGATVEGNKGALGGLRTAAWLVLGFGQALVAAGLYNLQAQIPEFARTILYPLGLYRWALVSSAMLVVLAWPYRHLLAARWRVARAGHRPWVPLLVNLVLFALLVVVTRSMRPYLAGEGLSSQVAISLHVLLLASVAWSWARIDVPLAAIGGIVRERAKATGLAVCLGLASLLIAEWVLSEGPRLAGSSLDLAWATWYLTGGLLGLVEPGLIANEAARTLTIGDFTVRVVETCAGYEGMALVATFVTLWLILMRGTLRFPQALLLYPIGLVSIWLLNSTRIAALTLIGGHVSPHVAMRGFHSRAGWIVFLVVCAAMLWALPRSGLLRKTEGTASGRSIRGAMAPTEAYLAPFIVLLAMSLLVAAMAPYDRYLYPLIVAGTALATWWCLPHVGVAWRSVSWALPPLLAGALIGVAWIATDALPAGDGSTALGVWLAGLPPVWAGLWLAVRGLQAIVLVPIVEELAFRGFLYRRLIAPAFETVSASHVSLLALVVSSCLFGLLHDRWLAAALAGAVYALVMVWRGRVEDAIVAHATSNALIFAWAVMARQWTLI